ncbi:MULTISPECIES: ABC transporter ATP-binding protein [Robiginitalea]|uniref:ATP-binding transport protein n=1 Tax=Robiginitalea biformata (strain ATCC BAA-864 / DSM 15991 / KCTC 12146 / HTCC2501) TaxID=313596 RepID=A4CHA9_ROBBH|nr:MULTISPECIES: ABC transporter ATP-binding protein [Robiginitalea]EAR16317.1 ATP-binding transport protein [Robiginitalea biformata HTCC2501]MDC6353416.1 ABC transporter ATP-binding protein [Robiginitalea sp. PM2]MDC6373419.1 ABC transporter ATP-binding protein [Robiginitalea sp. SP8]
MIQIDNVHKRFAKNEVLKGVDLQIPEGGIYAVLGPNGSGKTTLIKCVLGLVIPNKGDIRVKGQKVKNQWKYREEINYLPQIANFPGNIRVKELIGMIKDLRKKPGDEVSLIELFGLEPFLDKKLANLSGGTKQKVNLVLTFMFDSPVIILDEPTSGLDPTAMIALKNLIRKEREAGKTFLITTHIMQFVEEIADQVVYLLEGKIYYTGTLSGLLEKTGQHDLEHAIAAITSEKQHA